MMGNYHAPVHKLLAEVLRSLGRKRALVVRGNDGMDEISICDETKIFEVREGEFMNTALHPNNLVLSELFIVRLWVAMLMKMLRI